MRGELIYTSAPKGLKAGTSGFCTVGVTRGLPRREQQRLESLSGYDFLYGLSDPKAASNPTSYLHTKIDVGGVPHDVLSRVAFAGADHTGRSNKIAHHHLLDPQDRGTQGPAAAIQAIGGAGRFMHAWSGEPTEREAPLLGPILQQAPVAKGAPTWARVAGDVGWAGALVRAFKVSPKTPAILLVRPETDVLALFAESLEILPESERWDVCFTTYYTGSLPPDLPCHWRGAVEGSPAAEHARRLAGATVIDLTRPPGAAKEDRYTEAARTGRVLNEPVRLVATELGAKPARAERVQRESVVPEEVHQVGVELELIPHPEPQKHSRFGFETGAPRPEELSGIRSRGGRLTWLYYGGVAVLLAGGMWWVGSTPAPVVAPHSPDKPNPAPPQQPKRPTVPVAQPPTREPRAAPVTEVPSEAFPAPLPRSAEEATGTESAPLESISSASPAPVVSADVTANPGPASRPAEVHPTLTVVVDEPVALESIGAITTIMPIPRAGSPTGELAWVVSKTTTSMTIVNRLGNFVLLEPYDAGAAVHIRFQRKAELVTLGEITISTHKANEVLIQRRAKVDDKELRRILDLVPVELHAVGHPGRLLLCAPEPRTIDVAVNYPEGSDITIQGPSNQVLWSRGRFPPLFEFLRPEGPSDRFGTTAPAAGYPAWRIVEAKAAKDTYPSNESILKTKDLAWKSLPTSTSHSQETLADAELVAQSAVTRLIKAHKTAPRDIADLRQECRLRLDGRRIRWVDSWGVVRADVTLRWIESRGKGR